MTNDRSPSMQPDPLDRAAVEADYTYCLQTNAFVREAFMRLSQHPSFRSETYYKYVISQLCRQNAELLEELVKSRRMEAP